MSRSRLISSENSSYVFPSTMAMNSSPPALYRSPLSNMPFMTSAACLRYRSPPSWPRWSLISLRPFRSMLTIPTVSSPGPDMMASTRSIMAWRLLSPVSSSVTLILLSSALRRSLNISVPMKNDISSSRSFMSFSLSVSKFTTYMNPNISSPCLSGSMHTLLIPLRSIMAARAGDLLADSSLSSSLLMIMLFLSVSIICQALTTS